MAQPLRVFSLLGDSVAFVNGNIPVLMDHLKIIFPLALLMELINSFGRATGNEWVALLTIIPIIYLYACFALSWHRSSLMGADSAHAVNPFDFSSDTRSFVLLFFGIAFLPFLIGLFVGGAFGFASAGADKAIVAITGITAIIVSVYFLIQVIRYSFALPARSVGVKLSLKEARKVSKGLVWRILSAMGLAATVFGFAIMLYALIMGLTVGVITRGDEPSELSGGIVTFIFQVPLMVAGFYLMAINITILSKAYQWGMQNNAVSDA